MERTRAGLGLAAGRLNALSPLTVLGRGYALVQKEDGSLLRTIKDLNGGEQLQVTIADGKFGVTCHEPLKTHQKGV